MIEVAVALLTLAAASKKPSLGQLLVRVALQKPRERSVDVLVYLLSRSGPGDAVTYVLPDVKTKYLLDKELRCRPFSSEAARDCARRLKVVYLRDVPTFCDQIPAMVSASLVFDPACKCEDEYSSALSRAERAGVSVYP